jgi:putative membrane protein
VNGDVWRFGHDDRDDVILGVVLIAIGFYLLHRFINDRKKELTPMEILKVRLAKGEITLDEFEQLSKKL